MKLNERKHSFTTIGENIHTTRVLLRKGRRITNNPEGVESIVYINLDGQTCYLPIPETVKHTQDYEEGRIKHVKIAIQAAMSGNLHAKEGLNYLHYLVQRQLSAGADFLDLNVDEVSLKLSDQKKAMQWLVRIVQPMSTVPVSVDSSNIEIIEAGLKVCQTQMGRNLLNSASLERVEALDLARRHNTKSILTAAGEKGMPQNERERLDNASRMIDAALSKGIALEDIYVDVLVFPISVDAEFGYHSLETIRQLRAQFGSAIYITGGLSNVSFGLPCRRRINDVFILLALEAGADSGIIDPVTSNLDRVLSMDRQSRPYQLTEKMLLGEDQYCKNFLQAFRKGEL